MLAYLWCVGDSETYKTGERIESCLHFLLILFVVSPQNLQSKLEVDIGIAYRSALPRSLKKSYLCDSV